ncbi:hypothetical protein G6F32_017077 [Rhizopus arrhizus]|nr:hypothetical protein G6F32_017077 [Rhizopus arrhizus]
MNLVRAALDSLLADLDARARSMAMELNRSTDSGGTLALTRLREANGPIWPVDAGDAAVYRHEPAEAGARLFRGRSR